MPPVVKFCLRANLNHGNDKRRGACSEQYGVSVLFPLNSKPNFGIMDIRTYN